MDEFSGYTDEEIIEEAKRRRAKQMIIEKIGSLKSEIAKSHQEIMMFENKLETGDY